MKGKPLFLENIQHLLFTATQYCHSSGLSVFTSNTQTACLLSFFVVYVLPYQMKRMDKKHEAFIFMWLALNHSFVNVIFWYLAPQSCV